MDDELQVKASDSTKEAFLNLLLSSGALKFGNFLTKSGRQSPYFFNTGCFDSGSLLNQVAECYVDLLQQLRGPAYTVKHLYGPAYKGITLASACAQEWAHRSQDDVWFTFNRKEHKQHGEGGGFIGKPLSSDSRLIIVEDVMTGGTSIRETLDLLAPLGAKVQAVVIGVDREERGTDHRVARRQIEDDYGIAVYSLLGLGEILHLLWNRPRLGKVWVTDQVMAEAKAYRKTYGASS